MSGLHIVTPEEAQGLARAMEPLPPIFGDLAHTVVVQAERIARTEVSAGQGVPRGHGPGDVARAPGT